MRAASRKLSGRDMAAKDRKELHLALQHAPSRLVKTATGLARQRNLLVRTWHWRNAMLRAIGEQMQLLLFVSWALARAAPLPHPHPPSRRTPPPPPCSSARRRRTQPRPAASRRG